MGVGDRIAGFSVSVGVVSIEYAEAWSLSLQSAGAVDLRHAGQSSAINDSTPRSFYDQIGDPWPLDYAIVDLGIGNESRWCISARRLAAIPADRRHVERWTAELAILIPEW